MIFTAVDLPAPFSPRSATTRPAGSCSSTPSSALTPSKCIATPSSARTGVSAAAGVGMRAPGNSGLEKLRELLDVALVEHVGLGHRGFSIGVDLQLTHAAHRDLCARFSRGLLGEQRVRSIYS